MDLDQVYWIRLLEGVELLLEKESGLASFDAKVAPSLNGVGLIFMNSVTGSAFRSKCSNILDYNILQLLFNQKLFTKVIKNTKQGSLGFEIKSSIYREERSPSDVEGLQNCLNKISECFVRVNISN